MTILVYIEEAAVRGGIEVFAERHVAQLRAEGHEVVVACRLPPDFAPFDEIVVHKCSDVATLEAFPAEKTVYYIHDHEPICPRGYAYTPLKRNCARPGGVWPCILCAPACRSWRAALGRVFSQRRRIAAMARFKRLVVISEFMKSRLVANGLPPERISVEPPKSLPCAPAPSNPQPSAAPSVDLLYVGQLIRGKGVHLLLRAMARMKTPRTLDVVGTGNMEGELKALAADIEAGKDEALEAGKKLREEIEGLKTAIAKADEQTALLNIIKTGTKENGEPVQAKTLGEHFVKSIAGKDLGGAGSRVSVSAPEFKANTSPQTSPSDLAIASTVVDRRCCGRASAGRAGGAPPGRYPKAKKSCNS